MACLLLSLVLLVPAVGCHSTGPNDGAFEPGPEPTALLVFLPERLTLGNTETRYGETACLWPVPTRTAPAPLPLAVVVVTPALPLPRGTSPFPLRV